MKYPTVALALLSLCRQGSTDLCPVGPILTVNGGGRLGNCVWEYVSLYAVAKFIPTPHAVYSRTLINQRIASLFDNVTLPVVEGLPGGCRTGIGSGGNTLLRDFMPASGIRARFANATGNIVLPVCSVLIEPVVKFISEIKTVLPYKKRLVLRADEYLKRIRGEYAARTGLRNVIFVGVHIRRTDYVEYLPTKNLSVVGAEHYATGMEYFRSRRGDLGNPIFVVATDDLAWAKERFHGDDVFTPPTAVARPEEDLVLLSLCNHSIVDYGTFGLWAAVYTEGEVVAVYQKDYQEHIVFNRDRKWHFVNPKTNKFL